MRPTTTLLALCLLVGPSALPADAQGAPILVPTGEPFYIPLNDVQLAGMGNQPTVTVNGNLALDLQGIDICVGSDPSGTNCTGGGVSVEFDVKGAMALELATDQGGQFVGELALPEILIAIFYFPGFPNLTGQISIEGKFVVAGEVEAGMRLGVVGQYESQGAAVSNQRKAAGYYPPENVAFEFSPPELSGGGAFDLQIAFEAGVEVAIQFQGITVSTPYCKVRSGVELTVDPLDDPWWDADGFVVPLVGWDFGLAGTPQIVMAPNPFLFDVADADGPLPIGWAAAPARWSRTYDVLDAEMVTSVAPLGDDWAVVGQDGLAGDRGWVARLQAEGTPVWEQRAQLLLDAKVRPKEVHVNGAGEVVVGGYMANNSGARMDVYAADGTPLWTRGWTDSAGGLVDLESLIVTSDGGYALGGRVRRGTLGHPFVARTDAAGNVLWATEYELDLGATAQSAEGDQLIELSDGRFALFGDVSYEDGPFGSQTMASRNAFVLVLDSGGVFEWVRVLGGLGYDYATSGAEVDGGDLVLAGKVAFESEASWVARLDPQGTFLWSRTLAGEVTTDPNTGNTPNDLARGVVATEGGALVAGTTGVGVNTESWLAKVDHDGDVVWFKSLRGPDNDELLGLRRVEGGLIAWGRTRSLQPLGGGGDEDEMWIVRAPNDGMLQFDAANGFDALNDLREQSATTLVVSLDLPGQPVSMTLVDDTVLLALDVTAALVTLLTL